MNRDNLYGWVFTYNPFKGQWLATRRENYYALFSNQNDEGILKSRSIKVLEELIARTNGDPKLIKKLVNV